MQTVSRHPDRTAHRGEEQFFSDAGAVHENRSPAGESAHACDVDPLPRVPLGIAGDSLRQRVSSDPRMGRLT